MATRRRTPPRPVDKQLKKEERARRVVAKALADDNFMSGVRASLDARRQGQRGVRFEDVKRTEDA
jgi:hypothetical protein